ncbi:M24 family metallopeptidase [Alsobacter sp. R-9]
MAIGVGGSTPDAELNEMTSMRGEAPPIGVEERRQRLARARRLMRERGLPAMWLDVSTSLTYFTGLKLHRSERLHGVILLAEGDPIYVSPAFEVEKLRTMMSIDGPVAAWDEHEDPTELVVSTLAEHGITGGPLALDEATPFATVDRLRRSGPSLDLVSAGPVTTGCRIRKSPAELALMQTAMSITLAAQKAAARILCPGITTTEVQQFLVAAHQRLGAEGPPAFNIVLFGEATAYPHGVPYPQTLKPGDMVLVDVGAPVDGYVSDLTRTYVFGQPTDRQRSVWDLEKAAQAAAFAAARPGARCEVLDDAARSVIEAAGFGPGYATPGLPHRTGHGIGLDVHEAPYIVRGDDTPLAEGMTFSVEPMICLYGSFGVRLEDHVYMTAEGPRWFTPPATSIDAPFGMSA